MNAVHAVTLRPYQARAVADVYSAIDAGTRRVILVLPTGGGKTEIAAALFRSGRFARGLFLTHRLELVDQATERFRRYGVRVGVIQGSAPGDADAPVQVASVQTLANRAAPPADLVITDEAHHAPAGSFETVIRAYPDAVHVGLTATPYRLDGRGLGTLYEKLIVAAYPRELVELGYLVPPRIFTSADPDLTGVRQSMGDYAPGALAEAMVKLAGNVVETWQRHAADRQTVVFAVNIAHSLALRDRFLAAGVPAEHFDGGDDAVSRRATLARFGAGETRVLANCSLISEGFDLPSIGCVVMARPTMSRSLYKQQVGRALRPNGGKTDAILLDNAGNFARHGDPLDAEKYSLTDRVVVPNPTPTKQCLHCFAWIRATAHQCPHCGYASPVAEPREVRETTEQLVEVSQLQARYLSMGPDERITIYQKLESDRERLGFKPGWSAWQYKRKFGTWPEPEVVGRAEAGTSKPIEALRGWIATGKDRDYKAGWSAFRFKTVYGRWPTREEVTIAGS